MLPIRKIMTRNSHRPGWIDRNKGVKDLDADPILSLTNSILESTQGMTYIAAYIRNGHDCHSFAAAVIPISIHMVPSRG